MGCTPQPGRSEKLIEYVSIDICIVSIQHLAKKLFFFALILVSKRIVASKFGNVSPQNLTLETHWEGKETTTNGSPEMRSRKGGWGEDAIENPQNQP